MACTVLRPVTHEVTLNTTGQTRQKVLEIVEALFRSQANAIECGIMGHLFIAFGPESNQALGHDPGPELAKQGVISLKTTGSD